MHRREFLATGVAGALSVPALGRLPWNLPARPNSGVTPGDVRPLFPRLQHDVFLNAAAGTPLSTFVEASLQRYLTHWQQGPTSADSEEVGAARSGIHAAFAKLIHAKPQEIALVPCTKAGEQIVLDGLPALRRGGNVVTNDLHFLGSLHNLVGLRQAGLDVRIVQGDGRDVDLQRMADAMDERTALVCVTLVSNINGRFEALPELAKLAHERGAFVYADIIQAAGIVPIDVRAMDIDFAACSGYKWLYGPFGAGFLYVREELQGTVLEDRLYPGHARHNYTPWVGAPKPELPPFLIEPRTDARRYQPGHVSYMSYCALYEALKFIEKVGVEALQAHSVKLNHRLLDQVDQERFPCLSPHLDRAPILTLKVEDPTALQKSLARANVVVSLGSNRLRVSPAFYNTEEDVDRLAEALKG